MNETHALVAENREELRGTIASLRDALGDAQQPRGGAERRGEEDRRGAARRAARQPRGPPGAAGLAALGRRAARRPRRRRSRRSWRRSRRGRAPSGGSSTTRRRSTASTRAVGDIGGIAAKINSGEGSLGRLVTDDALVLKLEGTADSAQRLLGAGDRMHFFLGYRGEYLERASALKSYVTVKLQPRDDKYYLLELIDDPGGKVTTTTTKTTVTRARRRHVHDRRRPPRRRRTTSCSSRSSSRSPSGPLTFRGGLMESQGGVGLDYRAPGDRLQPQPGGVGLRPRRRAAPQSQRQGRGLQGLLPQRRRRRLVRREAALGLPRGRHPLLRRGPPGDPEPRELRPVAWERRAATSARGAGSSRRSGSGAARTAAPGTRCSRSPQPVASRPRARVRRRRARRCRSTAIGAGRRAADPHGQRRARPRARRRPRARQRRARSAATRASARRPCCSRCLGRLAAARGETVLYCSGEESPRQIRCAPTASGSRARRLAVLAQNALEPILAEVRRLRPLAVVVDSIQTVSTEALESTAGSISQVREVAAQLIALAKRQEVPVFLVGHVTKDGTHRRAAGARAHGRHRALLRGGEHPGLPHPARREEPLRLDQRDRRLRDARRRAARGAEPLAPLPARGARRAGGERRDRVRRGDAALPRRGPGALRALLVRHAEARLQRRRPGPPGDADRDPREEARAGARRTRTST